MILWRWLRTRLTPHLADADPKGFAGSPITRPADGVRSEFRAHKALAGFAVKAAQVSE